MKYDFGGWATRNDLQCADGRVIKKDAFKGQNGKTVPLVWMHNHTNPDNVLGLAHLENRDEGVYAFCEFNDTESGKTARELVKHGDVQSLSIFANQLKQAGHDVVHGIIREVSLVLAGANPGAFIDDVVMHGDGETGIILGYDEMIMGHLEHSDDKKKKEDEKEKNTVLWVLAIIGAVAAVAGIAFAVYRFFAPDYLEDFEEDFDDDFDDYFEDEEK